MSKLLEKVLGQRPKVNEKKPNDAPENPVPAKKNAVPAAQTKEAVRAAKKAEQARHKAAVRQGNLISRTVLNVYPVRDCRKSAPECAWCRRMEPLWTSSGYAGNHI